MIFFCFIKAVNACLLGRHLPLPLEFYIFVRIINSTKTHREMCRMIGRSSIDASKWCRNMVSSGVRNKVKGEVRNWPGVGSGIESEME